MENESLEKAELNMLERMAVYNIAENAFKKNIQHVEELEGKDLDYISVHGEKAEKLFYEHTRILEYNKKFPRPSKKRELVKRIYTSQKRY